MLKLLFAISALVIAGASFGEQVMELPSATHEEVSRLSKEGDDLAAQGKYRDAVVIYIKAFDLLPDPKEQWEACTWLLAAIGDANFLSKNYEHARAALTDAMHCPGAIGNPFIHLRLGQSQYELGNKDRAADELARAYMGAGAEIFGAEDPKYFALVKSVLRPPASGKW